MSREEAEKKMEKKNLMEITSKIVQENAYVTSNL